MFSGEGRLYMSMHLCMCILYMYTYVVCCLFCCFSLPGLVCMCEMCLCIVCIYRCVYGKSGDSGNIDMDMYIDMCIYMYIYRERERESEHMCIYTYTYTSVSIALLTLHGHVYIDTCMQGQRWGAPPLRPCHFSGSDTHTQA